MDLVILAAGMGSRFGGLKQIEPIDAEGNFIIDYSIYDAKKAGFSRVVFIIKEENYEIFKATIGKRVEGKMEVLHCFQKLSDVPAGYDIPKDRVKPFGTSQALLAAKAIVDEKFVMINADDYYGYDAFRVAGEYLRSLPQGSQGVWGNVAYECANTMTANGAVKRGVLLTDASGKLTSLIESSVSYDGDEVLAEPLDGAPSFKIARSHLVSMNMFCFTRDIMDRLEEGFVPFMEANKGNLAKCEYLVPTSVGELVEKGEVSVDVLHTSAVWHGITYKADKEELVQAIEALKKEGAYPAKLNA